MSIPDLRHNEGVTGIDLSLAVEGTNLKSAVFSPPGRLEQASGLFVDVSGQKITGKIPSGTADQVYTVDLVYEDDSTDCFTWTIDQGTLIHGGKHLKVLVPNYTAVETGSKDPPQHSYLRMGMPDQDDENILKTKEGDQDADVRGPGWYEYTSERRTTETGGNYYKIVHGEASDFFYSDQFDFSSHNKYGVYKGTSFDYSDGTASEVFFGSKYSSIVGFEVETSLAAKFEYGCGLRYSATLTTDRTLSRDIEQEASKSVNFKVDPDDGVMEAVFETLLPLAAAGTSAYLASVGRLAATSTEKGAAKDAAKRANGMSQFVGTSATVLGFLDWSRAKFTKKDRPASEFLMDRDKIRLECCAPLESSLLAEKVKGSKLGRMGAAVAAVPGAVGGAVGGAGAAAVAGLKKRVPQSFKNAKKSLDKWLKARDPDKEPAWIEVSVDKVEIRCGKAGLILHQSGGIQLRNDKARLEISEKGVIDLRNEEGGTLIDKSQALLVHEKVATIGLAGETNLDKPVKADVGKRLRFVPASVTCKHTKGDLGGQATWG